MSALTIADGGRDHRQIHVIDAHGRAAAYTGKACIDWCGHLAGDNISVAGNMLAGASVIEHTAAAYERNAALPFPRRLIAALRAGEAAGGDKRGKQSAALVILRRRGMAGSRPTRRRPRLIRLPSLNVWRGSAARRFVHFRRSCRAAAIGSA